MVELNAEPGREYRFELADDPIRGSRGSATTTVALREAAVLKLDQKLIGDDPVLLAELRRLSREYRHFFVSFGCTFMPGDNEPVSSAEVLVELDPDSTGGAFIHSMRPDRLLDSTSITSSAKLDANFQLGSMGIGGEAKFDHKDPFLVAFPLGSRGSWEFTRTRQSKIAGYYPLQFIVRAPAGNDPMSGRISLTVLVHERRFFIVSSERRDRAAEINFTCS